MNINRKQKKVKGNSGALNKRNFKNKKVQNKPGKENCTKLKLVKQKNTKHRVSGAEIKKS